MRQPTLGARRSRRDNTRPPRAALDWISVEIRASIFGSLMVSQAPPRLKRPLCTKSCEKSLHSAPRVVPPT